MTPIFVRFPLVVISALLCAIPAVAACPAGMQEITALTTRNTSDALAQNACYDPVTGYITYFNATVVGSTALSGQERVLVTSSTIAEVNTGTTILAGVTGRTITVTGVTLISLGGTVGTCTDVRISSTAGSPVDMATGAAASLTQNTLFTDTSRDAGLAAAGVSGEGLQIRKTGGTCDTSTGVISIVRYIASGR